MICGSPQLTGERWWRSPVEWLFDTVTIDYASCLPGIIPDPHFYCATNGELRLRPKG